MALSKTQLDRLGDRLRKGSPTDTDLRQLDEYRRSFGSASEQVVAKIREKLRLEPTARPAKSTTSLVEKLKRESIRLTQVQDIAGCRVVVRDMADQDQAVRRLRRMFRGAAVVDRRKKPSHGYRAVHIIPRVAGRMVEIQIRTALQHQWAEMSEKFADRVGIALKYGGGLEVVREALDVASKTIAAHEIAEAELAKTAKQARKIDALLPEDLRKGIATANETIAEQRKQIAEVLEAAVRSL